MHRRYGQIAIGVAIVGVAAGGTTAAVAWANSGGSSSSSVTTSDAKPASVLGLETAKPSATPTPASTTPPAPAITPPAPPSPTATALAAPAPKPPITYVVKKGDNLSVIAWWFHVHGYGAIYDANKSVIGDNPNLIFAGQRLTIANGHLTASSS